MSKFLIPENKILKMNNNFGVNTQIKKVNYSYIDTNSTKQESLVEIDNSNDFIVTINENGVIPLNSVSSDGNIVLDEKGNTTFKYYGESNSTKVVEYWGDYVDTSYSEDVCRFKKTIAMYEFDSKPNTFIKNLNNYIAKTNSTYYDLTIIKGYNEKGIKFSNINKQINYIDNEIDLDNIQELNVDDFKDFDIYLYIEEVNINKIKGKMYTVTSKTFYNVNQSQIRYKWFFQNYFQLFLDVAQEINVETSLGNTQNTSKEFNMSTNNYFREDIANKNVQNILSNYENGKKIISLQIVGGDYFGINGRFPRVADTFSILRKNKGVEDTKYMITSLETNYNGVLTFNIEAKEI